MKRFLTAILSVCLLFALLFGGTGSLFACAANAINAAKDVNASKDVSAAPADTTADTVTEGGKITLSAQSGNDGDKLILPSSYEQYLPLEAPTGIAVSDNYTAISDGTKIYVYDRVADAYRLYRHATNNNLTKLQFSDDGLLYFSDTALKLYALSPETMTAEETGISCSTFTIFASGLTRTVYFSTVSGNHVQIYKNDDSHPVINEVSTTTNPAITHDENGVLYYTSPSGDMLYRAGDSPGGEKPFAYLPHKDKTASPVRSVAILGSVVYYTDDKGVFYAYNLYDLTNLQTADNAVPVYISPDAGNGDSGYSALSVFNGYVYVVKDSGVRQYSPALKNFTDYEIDSSSDSATRLSGASETILCGNLLLTADTENFRISIFNADTGAVSVIPVEGFMPTLAATDGETVLAANASAAALYMLDGGTPVQSFSEFSGNIVGVAGVFGKYYFVTDGGYYYCAQIEETEEEGRPASGWTIRGVSKHSSNPPRLLAADIYGRLYLAAGNEVYRFEESEFLNKDAEGTKVASVHAQSQKIAVDYAGNVYSLYNNELISYSAEQGAPQIKYTLTKSPVYNGENALKVTSFAFGAEEKATYVLYEGNFILRTYDIDLPTVKDIPVNGADENIFSDESAEFSLVRTAKNTLMVYFDIGKLKGAEVFPYLFYGRETEEKIALKLGGTDKYNLIAVFDEETKSYSTALVLNERYCTEIPREEYLESPDGFKDGAGYLTNEAELYKYPYLTELLTVRTIPKNAALTVLGKIDALDYHYYYVSYTDGEGQTRTGYIPQAYVTNFNGAPPESEVIAYGAEAADHDSLWRMAFLLLGCASVCVLADYLILHKRKQ